MCSASDNGSQCGPPIREHSLPDGLPNDAQSHEADCGGWDCDAASVARATVRECAGARVNGGAVLGPAHVAHQRSADERVDAERKAGGAGAVVGTTGRTALADCRLVVVPEHGGHLREAPPQPASARAEEGVARASFGVSIFIC